MNSRLLISLLLMVAVFSQTTFAQRPLFSPASPNGLYHYHRHRPISAPLRRPAVPVRPAALVAPFHYAAMPGLPARVPPRVSPSAVSPANASATTVSTPSAVSLPTNVSAATECTPVGGASPTTLSAVSPVSLSATTETTPTATIVTTITAAATELQ